MNWVVQHWRTDRNDPDDEIYVRKHLRGATSFDWFGFGCEIKAPLAVRENEELRAERALMNTEDTRRLKR